MLLPFRGPDNRAVHHVCQDLHGQQAIPVAADSVLPSLAKRPQVSLWVMGQQSEEEAHGGHNEVGDEEGEQDGAGAGAVIGTGRDLPVAREDHVFR
jgi:hypothetical protein